MSSGRKKRQVKLARDVVAGKITVEEARRKFARQQARSRQPARQPARQQQQPYGGLQEAARSFKAATAKYDAPDPLRDAVRKAIARPVITKAAAAPSVMKSIEAVHGYRPPAAVPAAPVPPPQQWTGLQRALYDQSEHDPDPMARERARQQLVQQGLLAGTGRDETVTKGARMLTWGPGRDGTYGWQSPSQPPPTHGLQIAPPGSAGR
jgi:hypothetical protein